MFVAGVVALGVGIATGSPEANGKSSADTRAPTPVAQVVAPAGTGQDLTPPPPVNVAPAPPGPENPAPSAPPANAGAAPAPPPANSAPPPANNPPQVGPAAPAATATPPRAVSTPALPRATPTVVPRGPGLPVAPQASNPAPLGAADLSGMEQKLYVLQNAFRGANSLAALQLDPRLVAIARTRAQDMVARNYFSHTSPTGETAFGLLSQSGYLYTIAGENIARNNYPDGESPNIAMDGFLNSPSHKENVMDGRFKNVGIGVATGPDGMKYFAVVFAS